MVKVIVKLKVLAGASGAHLRQFLHAFFQTLAVGGAEVVDGSQVSGRLWGLQDPLVLC